MSECDALSSRIYMLEDMLEDTNPFKDSSAISRFLSEIRISRITLSIGSIATQAYI